MLPGRASLAAYGGSKKDYSAASDSTTDRIAAGTNPAYSDLASCTRMVPRVWASIRVKAAGTTPDLVAHDEVWNDPSGRNLAPVQTRFAAGVLTLTYPAVVFDEIPPGQPGYNANGTAVNLRAAWANSQGGTTWYDPKATVTAPNVITIDMWKLVAGSPAHGDPGADVVVDVYAL